jgi:hypothetical protein
VQCHLTRDNRFSILDDLRHPVPGDTAAWLEQEGARIARAGLANEACPTNVLIAMTLIYGATRVVV